MRHRPAIFLALLLSSQSSLAQDKLLPTLTAELKREMEGFSKTAQPPYFISYSVTETWAAELSASFGSLTRSDTAHARLVAVDVRVGDYAFDDTHPTEEGEEMVFRGSMRGGIDDLPLDNRPEAIQVALWKQTQQSYAKALENYKNKKSLPANAAENIPDFTREAPVESIDPALPAFSAFFDPAAWTKRIQAYSAPFVNQPQMVDGDVSLDVVMERKYFVSSEGAQIAQNRTSAYLMVRGSMRTEGSDVVPLNLSYFAFDPSQLPSEEVIGKDIATLIEKLSKLRLAPVAEPYTGPAILHARAAGVFFHEIFGHRVEGQRLKDKSDGQTFKGKIKEQVLPTSLSVVFDPTVDKFNGQALNGHYKYDDEGVRGQKVRVVNKGVLETFLMSRTPIEHFSKSNGHGRGEKGASPVSRQSNLIIENDKVVPMTELRKMLIAECKKQKIAYGYLFMDVVGGFTTTQRYMPNAFNIFPTEVYRIYVDGRPDELVRGVDLIGTPLAMFAEIIAADGSPETFTGFCGAESGSVPVTAISPSLFVKRIETQKKPTTRVDDMLIKRPGR